MERHNIKIGRPAWLSGLLAWLAGWLGDWPENLKSVWLPEPSRKVLSRARSMHQNGSGCVWGLFGWLAQLTDVQDSS